MTKYLSKFYRYRALPTSCRTKNKYRFCSMWNIRLMIRCHFSVVI